MEKVPACPHFRQHMAQPCGEKLSLAVPYSDLEKAKRALRGPLFLRAAAAAGAKGLTGLAQ
jgi:hypothetical protein